MLETELFEFLEGATDGSFSLCQYAFAHAGLLAVATHRVDAVQPKLLIKQRILRRQLQASILCPNSPFRLLRRTPRR